jgi:type IV pilus assembly protein PilV
MRNIQLNRNLSPGFTLLEVLIALLILSMGLLGLAALQGNALKFNQSGYQRSQATLLAYDMLDRMRVNRTTAMTTTSYQIGSLTNSPPAASNCASVTCNGTQLATYDKAQWITSVFTQLPNGQGAVTYQDAGSTRIYTIEIRWTDVEWDDTQNAKEGLVRSDNSVFLRSEI